MCGARMDKYALTLMVLQILCIGMELGEDDVRGVLSSTLGLLLTLPLVGRVCGWW